MQSLEFMTILIYLLDDKNGRYITSLNVTLVEKSKLFYVICEILEVTQKYIF